VHEMSLCEGVLQVLQDNAASQQFSRVKTVWLEVGPFAGVEVDALRFCFDVVCRGTLAEGAALEVIEPPGQGWCMQCSETVSIQQRFDPCPRCGGYQLQTTGGDELRIKELEVD